MKAKNYLLIAGLLLLSGCQNEIQPSRTGGENPTPISRTDFVISCNEDYSYSFSFQMNRRLEENESLCFSSDGVFDGGDEKISCRLDLNESGNYSASFSCYTKTNDFYFLIVDGQGKILASENFVLPTFNVFIKTGTENKAGRDILSFSYLENGYTSSNFFDEEGITIYRSATPDFNDSSRETVLKNQNISDEFVLPNEENKPFYRISSVFGSGKGVYNSQTFRKDSFFGKDLVWLDSVSLQDDDNHTHLKLSGSVSKEIKKRDLLLIDSKEQKSHYESIPIVSRSFDINSRLPEEEGLYHAYFSLNAGIYFPIDNSSFLSVPSPKKYSGSYLYSLYDDNGFLCVNINSFQDVNIISLSLDKENEKPVLRISGLFDSDKFGIDPTTGETRKVYEPILALLSDDFKENLYFPLVITGNRSFSVSADLSGLTKLGIWYSIKLFFNSTKGTNEDPYSVFSNQATYERKIPDADSFSQEARFGGNKILYHFQSYREFLKLEIKDYSASITEWKYVLVNNRRQLRLCGTFYHGASEIDIYYGSGKDHHISEVVVDDNYSFIVDVDIEDIKSYTKYNVHWIGDRFGDNQINDEYIPKPHARLSNHSGYIYSVKQESLGTTKYFKVYKDIDSAKASDIVFSSNDVYAYATVFGYVNSDLNLDNLYLQFAKCSFAYEGGREYSDSSYSLLSVNEDYSFQSTVDISNREKNAYYQLKLVHKNGKEVSEVTTERTTYCGFYTEYLPQDFDTKALSTKRGTYRIRNFGGLNGHWEIYLILV